MTVTFISNYLSHHQLPFCLEMQRQLGEGFRFVATDKISEKRLLLGYPNLNRTYPFVIRAYEDDLQDKQAYELVDRADVVIIGSAPLKYVQCRLANRKLTFLYTERIYKKSVQYWKLPVRLLRFWKTYGRYRSLYLLCSSAYTASDFAKTFTFLNKAYRWGYFPATKRYDDIEQLMKQKIPGSLVWAGRFIDWKHPEYVVEIASRLKAAGYQFRINMIGNGEMLETIRQMVTERNLQEQVILTGAMSPEEVRQYMEQSEVYLFTSDRTEGWGAVTNEAMNSGCAVTASHIIGAVPFLVQDKENGLIYQDGDIDDLYNKVRFLLDNPQKRAAMGKTAYETITEQWNAENAAKRLLSLCEALCKGEKSPELFANGVCSKAPLLKNNWYKS